MKCRNRFVLSLVAICLIGVPAAYAASTSVNSLTHGIFSAKPKTIKISLRNDTKSSLELTVGFEIVTLQPGKTISMKLPVGTRIISNTTTQQLAAGDLIVEVTNGLYDDATFVIH